MLLLLCVKGGKPAKIKNRYFLVFDLTKNMLLWFGITKMVFVRGEQVDPEWGCCGSGLAI